MSRPDQAIFMISVTYTENDMGDSIKVYTKRLVFAEKKSIRHSEFYQAQSTGLQPELEFVVWTSEYSQEPMIEFDSKEYNIIRTFDRADGRTELTCQGIVNRVM